MTSSTLVAPIVPVDQPSHDAYTADARRQAKQNLWGIDKGILDGQMVAKADDGKRLEGGIVIPDNKNSI